MAGRKIAGEADAQQCLAALEASGLALADWARGQGIDGRSLRMWWLNLARRTERSQTPRLVELVTSSPTRPSAPTKTTYVVRCGRFAVELGDDFDEDALFRILEVVASC